MGSVSFVMFLIAAGVVLSALTAALQFQLGEPQRGAVAVLVTLGFVFLLLGPGMQWTIDTNHREYNERLLASTDRSVRVCASVLTEKQNSDDQRSQAEKSPREQADAAGCVFGEMETLASNLSCRVDDVVPVPLTASAVLASERERWAAASNHYAALSTQQQPTSGHEIANVQVPSDDLVWPVLSGNRADAWVYWPDGGDQITVRLPSEPEFHDYCLDLATVPRPTSGLTETAPSRPASTR